MLRTDSVLSQKVTEAPLCLSSADLAFIRPFFLPESVAEEQSRIIETRHNAANVVGRYSESGFGGKILPGNVTSCGRARVIG